MNPVSVITGGGSGMGLATARILGQNHRIVICGRTRSKLDRALAELTELGIDAHAIACDVADRASVEALVEFAARLGPVKVVINAAGIAPQMGSAEDILRINALGAVFIHDTFLPRMAAGGCLIDVGSTGGYMVHPLLLPTRAYRMSRTDPQSFLNGMMARARWFPKRMRPGLAYCISKNFLMWYARAEAARFAQRNIRVLTVSPGSFATDMGALAKDGADKLIQFCAIRRYGEPDEIAQLLAFCADPRMSYLTGVDILCDGGCLAGCRNDPIGFLRMQIDLLRAPLKPALGA